MRPLLTLICQFEALDELKSFGSRTDSLHRVQAHFASLDELLRIVAVVFGLLVVFIILGARGVQQAQQVLQFAQALVGVVQVDHVIPIVHIGQLVDGGQVVRLHEHRVLRMTE